MKNSQAYRLYGIFGHPLSHTLSPSMQEAAFQKLGLEAHYLVFDLMPKFFKKVMSRSAKLPLSGFNITVPYKQTVVKYLDKISPEARMIGAVNTAFRRGTQWVGTNTDMEGFLLSLEKEGKFRLGGKKAVILGAGGAARAVVCGLSKKRVREILVTDCFPEKAFKIVRDFKKIFPKTQYQAVIPGAGEVRVAVREANLVINATPLGLKPKDPAVIPGDWIPHARGKKKLFMDLIYNPEVTPFLSMARRKGHWILNGLPMLLYQGARALEYWTGRRAPVGVMRRALLEALKGKKRP